MCRAGMLLLFAAVSFSAPLAHGVGLSGGLGVGLGTEAGALTHPLSQPLDAKASSQSLDATASSRPLDATALSQLLEATPLSRWLVTRPQSAAEAAAQARALQHALEIDRRAAILNAFWAWSRAYSRLYTSAAEVEDALHAFGVNLDIQLRANLAAAGAAGGSVGAWYALNEFSATPHQALQTNLKLSAATPSSESRPNATLGPVHPSTQPSNDSAAQRPPSSSAAVTADAKEIAAAAAVSSALAFRRTPRAPRTAWRPVPSPKMPRALLRYLPPPLPPPSDGASSTTTDGPMSMPLPSTKFVISSDVITSGRSAVPVSATGRAATLPTAVDWTSTGKLAPVRNQGASCASCWAEAATSAMEAASAIAHDRPPVRLSSQMVIDCAHPSVSVEYTSDGCRGGDSRDAFTFMSRHNIASAQLYPSTSWRTGVTGQCDRRWLTPGADDASLQPGPSGSVFYPPHHEGHLRKAVASRPVVIYWHMGLNFNAYAGGVYDLQDQTHPALGCSASDISTLDHAMMVVGFNSEQNIWIIQNSFGTTWGENGFMRVRMTNDSYGPCGMYWYNVGPQMPSASDAGIDANISGGP